MADVEAGARRRTPYGACVEYDMHERDQHPAASSSDQNAATAARAPFRISNNSNAMGGEADGRLVAEPAEQQYVLPPFQNI
uniref:Uncharacterized protein n=1 Tax=Oryza sativa subsp. japonica TaxID=39947 RepID=Q6ZJI6_ORYSJ|nr:hypothetical protein [Oryza sativa Japonica Group]